MSDLEALVQKMLAEVKQQKGKKKRKKKSQKEEKAKESSSIKNPFIDEALVLLATTHRCLRCSNESMSWSSELYIQRREKSRKKFPLLKIEQITTPEYSATYGALPKRVDMRIIETPTCPLCFGIGDNRGDNLTGELTPIQLPLL